MTSQQEAAFQAGSGFSSSVVLTTIASTVLTLTFIWVAWLALGSFRAWYEGHLETFDLLWHIIRACIVLAVLGFYVR